MESPHSGVPFAELETGEAGIFSLSLVSVWCV